METIEVLFYLLLTLIVYPYFIYPLAIYSITKLYSKDLDMDSNVPFVTLMISAYNEERIIEKKILNSLDLSYPKNRIQILVISDLSTDETNNIVRSYENLGVDLYVSSERQGKTAGLNQAIKLAKGEIVVFSDADAMYSSDSVTRMVNILSDKNIGLVTGSTDYVVDGYENMVATSSMYTQLERFLKRMESKIGSCVGADGAIFALRKSLFSPLNEDDINDLVIPLKVVHKGYRVIYDDQVRCFEPPSVDAAVEFKRQVRITNRTLWALYRNAHLMNVFKYPLFAFEMISHKLLRFTVPIFMIFLLLINILISSESELYYILLICQIGFYALGAVGYLFEKIAGKQSKLSIITHFILVQLSILLGWIGFISGKKQVIWKPRN